MSPPNCKRCGEPIEDEDDLKLMSFLGGPARCHLDCLYPHEQRDVFSRMADEWAKEAELSEQAGELDKAAEERRLERSHRTWAALIQARIDQAEARQRPTPEGPLTEGEAVFRELLGVHGASAELYIQGLQKTAAEKRGRRMGYSGFDARVLAARGIKDIADSYLKAADALREVRDLREAYDLGDVPRSELEAERARLQDSEAVAVARSLLIGFGLGK